MHPRGEDSSIALSSGSGRTLSSLNDGESFKTANRYWCRSDVRYDRVFYSEAGVNAEDVTFTERNGNLVTVTPKNGEFRGWGRMNC